MDKELFAALEYWNAIKNNQRRGTMEMAWVRLRRALNEKISAIDNEMYDRMEGGEVDILDFEIGQDPPIYH